MKWLFNAIGVGVLIKSLQEETPRSLGDDEVFMVWVSCKAMRKITSPSPNKVLVSETQSSTKWDPSDSSNPTTEPSRDVTGIVTSCHDKLMRVLWDCQTIEVSRSFDDCSGSGKHCKVLDLFVFLMHVLGLQGPLPSIKHLIK